MIKATKNLQVETSELMKVYIYVDNTNSIVLKYSDFIIMIEVFYHHIVTLKKH